MTRTSPEAGQNSFRIFAFNNLTIHVIATFHEWFLHSLISLSQKVC